VRKQQRTGWLERNLAYTVALVKLRRSGWVTVPLIDMGPYKVDGSANAPGVGWGGEGKKKKKKKIGS